MARILGIDHGERRIGLAVSDPMQMIATAHSTLDQQVVANPFEEIRSLCADLGVERVVVGWPVNMDGSIGPTAERVQAFIDKLGESLSCPIQTWDERWSTRSAETALREGGAKQKRRKEILDQVAAQIMLQNYLDAQLP